MVMNQTKKMSFPSSLAAKYSHRTKFQLMQQKWTSGKALWCSWYNWEVLPFCLSWCLKWVCEGRIDSSHLGIWGGLEARSECWGWQSREKEMESLTTWWNHHGILAITTSGHICVWWVFCNLQAILINPNCRPSCNEPASSLATRLLSSWSGCIWWSPASLHCVEKPFSTSRPFRASSQENQSPERSNFLLTHSRGANCQFFASWPRSCLFSRIIKSYNDYSPRPHFLPRGAWPHLLLPIVSTLGSHFSRSSVPSSDKWGTFKININHKWLLKYTLRY